MLLVLLFTALSASVSHSADSVRATPKPGAARPDTTLPAPTITAPKQPAPEIKPPISPVSSGTQRAPQTPAVTPTAVVQQAAPAATSVSSTMVDAKPSAPPESVVATATPAAPSPLSAKDSAAKVVVAPPTTAKSDPTSTVSASTPTSVVASSNVSKEAKVVTAPDSKPAPEAKPAAEVKAPVVAPADAVAAAASPRNAATMARVDPRTVVSVRSSERFEPLYAVPLPSARIKLGAPAAADSIVVYKRERTLVLFNRGVPVRTYFVALGSKPVGDKERAGDQRTPEGVFYINAHNPASKFHLALRISYPDDAHRARAAALGVDPGGDIMIHGLPKEYSEAGTNHLQNDWTNGCVALSNHEIEEIWRAVPDGTPVQIKP